MLKISFDNSDKLLQAKQILAANNITVSNGPSYRTLVVDFNNKKEIIKLLKKEKIRCDVSGV